MTCEPMFPGSARALACCRQRPAGDREPATAEVAELEHRARRLYWLNPEPRSEWDTLDSRASDYGRHCTNTFEVSTIRELIAAVTEIV